MQVIPASGGYASVPGMGTLRSVYMYRYGHHHQVATCGNEAGQMMQRHQPEGHGELPDFFIQSMMHET